MTLNSNHDEGKAQRNICLPDSKYLAQLSWIMKRRKAMGSWREAVGTLLHVGALKSDILTGCPGWSVLGLLCPQSVLTEGISIPETLPFNTPGHPRDLSKLDPLTFPPPPLCASHHPSYFTAVRKICLSCVYNVVCSRWL